MTAAELAILAGYYLVLSLLAGIGLHRVWLLSSPRRKPPETTDHVAEGTASVLVQLPLYNEPAVATRLLSHAAKMEVVSRLQVLDDSTDSTPEVIARLLDSLPGETLFPIEHIRRNSRVGFKAGALADGLAGATEEFVVIFDADFAPPADFVPRMLPRLVAEPGASFIQARWGHLNRVDSWLTRAQALLLDGHFQREHAVRATNGFLFNFNGTAGIWRRSAIAAAGGWQHDTLTEDFDLSWRAQLLGWRGVYAPDVEVPAELPSTWEALRGQQARWTRGSLQCLRKLHRAILAAPLPLAVRIEAFMPMLANLSWPLMLAMMVLSLPAFRIRQARALDSLVPLDLAMLLPCTLAFLWFYAGLARERGTGLLRSVGEAVLAMLLAAGLVVNNCRAALAGLLGGPGEFIRTPKTGGGKRMSAGSRLRPERAVEAALTLYLIILCAEAVGEGVYLALPFPLFFATALLWAASGMPLGRSRERA